MRHKILVSFLCITLLLGSLFMVGFSEDDNDSIIGLEVPFGHYEQNNDQDYGSESIIWVVLDETDTSIMLECVSKCITA